MNTNELIGPLLDMWTARAIGDTAEIHTDEKGDFCRRTVKFENGGNSSGLFDQYRIAAREDQSRKK